MTYTEKGDLARKNAQVIIYSPMLRDHGKIDQIILTLTHPLQFLL